MFDITIGQYYPTSSLIHKMDPRTKILFALFFMVMIFLLSEGITFALMGVLTALIVVASRVPLKFYFKSIKPLLFIIVFTAILNLFLTEGEALFTIPYLNWIVTKEGVERAVFMILRLTFLLLGTSALTFTTPPMALTDGIEKLLSPFSKIGVPSHEIAMMMTIALRFIPTFAEEADKIRKAQSARGADFTEGTVIERVKAMIPILVPLFIGAFRRADELAVAMESRCYKGGKGRTSLKKLEFSALDLIPLSIAFIIVALVIFFKIK